MEKVDKKDSSGQKNSKYVHQRKFNKTKREGETDDKSESDIPKR